MFVCVCVCALLLMSYQPVLICNLPFGHTPLPVPSRHQTWRQEKTKAFVSVLDDSKRRKRREERRSGSHAHDFRETAVHVTIFVPEFMSQIFWR